MDEDQEQEQELDAGAYIGHEPELAADSIPDGVRRGDERVAATASESTGVGAAERRLPEQPAPEGHRQGSRASDDDVWRAGENH